MNPDRPVVLLVEDHALLAESLAAALAADGIDLFRPKSLDPEAVAAAADERAPQVVLLDLHLDETTTSLPLIAPLVARGRTVVMLTAETDRVELARCVEAGAHGIVGKAEPFDRLVAAVERAVDGGVLLPDAEREDLLAELRRRRAGDRARLAPFESLTPKERRVLAALVEGWSAEQMADSWFVSMATIRSQIRAVLSKLGVNSQLAAVAAARAAGWVPEQ